MVKRIFDIALAALLLVPALPVMLVLAVAIRLESRGPVLYRALRAGRFGRPFTMLKMRSMVMDAEAVGGPSTAGDDPRVTRVGAMMRRYKLDELPQLLNVLGGSMSFVGPRPEVLSEVESYTTEQRRALELRPGITDWASIWNSDEGAVLAGAEDPHQVYKQRIQPTKIALQLKYRDESSLAVDLKILWFTLYKLARKGWLPAELEPYGRLSE